MKKLLTIVLTLALLAALFAGCAKTDDTSDGAKDDVNDGVKDDVKGDLVVYMNANFPPFEFMGSGTDIQGVDVEIAQAVADKLGRKLVLNNADFDGLLMSLASGKCDFSISGITITDERKETVDFSDPYIRSVQYLILPADSNIATMEDLAGKKVGSPLGYTGQYVMEDEISDGVLVGKNTDLKIYKSAIEGSLEIVSGKLDAVIMDEFVAKKIASENDKLKAVQLFYENGDEIAEEYGIAVKKGDTEMMSAVNEVIADLISKDKIKEWVIKYSE